MLLVWLLDIDADANDSEDGEIEGDGGEGEDEDEDEREVPKPKVGGDVEDADIRVDQMERCHVKRCTRMIFARTGKTQHNIVSLILFSV